MIHEKDLLYSSQGIYERFSYILNPSFKGAQHLESRWFHHYARHSHGATMKRVLRDTLYGEPLGLLFYRNDPLLPLLNHKLHQLFDCGIVQHLVSQYDKYLDPNYYKRPLLLTKEYLHEIYPKMHPSGPKVLSMEQLEAGFVVCFFPLVLSLLAFLFEWLATLRLYVVMIYALSAYFKEQNIKESTCNPVSWNCCRRCRIKITLEEKEGKQENITIITSDKKLPPRSSQLTRNFWLNHI
jgi:hypothetical protein